MQLQTAEVKENMDECGQGWGFSKWYMSKMCEPKWCFTPWYLHFLVSFSVRL